MTVAAAVVAEEEARKEAPVQETSAHFGVRQVEVVVP
jgi:hypothetical protein